MAKRRHHGMSKTLIYSVWESTKRRCSETMCVRWRDSFIIFYEDMGDRPTIEHYLERFDKNGSYELSNCYWKKRHKMHGTPVYRSWVGMKTRCLNPNSKDYEYYGGRGIKICARWLDSFSNFYADMGDKPSVKHSIDRIDNEEGYTPNNCRWSTPRQQCNNRSNNILIRYRGEEKTLTEWARSQGMRKSTLWARIVVMGWSAERAIEQPVRKYRTYR